MPEGILGFGILKDRRLGQPKTEAERAATHERIFGTNILPQRGTGLGQAGLGIIPNIQKKIREITGR